MPTTDYRQKKVRSDGNWIYVDLDDKMGDIETKIVRTAFCRSKKCAGNLLEVVKDVALTTTWCPDCDCALYWKTKQLIRRVNYEQTNNDRQDLSESRNKDK